MQAGFKPGEFVKGEHYSNAALEIEGFLYGEDEDDHTFGVLYWDAEAEVFTADWLKTPETEESAPVHHLDQCPAALRPLLNAKPKAETVFVCDWQDAGTTNVQMFREPQDVMDALGDGLDTDERKNLQRQLMESVASGGERHETAGGIGVRFMVIP